MDFPWAVPAPRNHRQTVPACGVCSAKRMISSKHPGPRFTLLPLAGCRLCGQLTGQRGPTEVLSSICHPLSQLCPPLNDISGKAQSVLLAFCLRRRRTAYSSVNLVWHILSLSSRGASWSCAQGSGKGGPRGGWVEGLPLPGFPLAETPWEQPLPTSRPGVQPTVSAAGATSPEGCLLGRGPARWLLFGSHSTTHGKFTCAGHAPPHHPSCSDGHGHVQASTGRGCLSQRPMLLCKQLSLQTQHEVWGRSELTV